MVLRALLTLLCTSHLLHIFTTVPVAALEWRIREDVPVNILAVSKSARARNILEQPVEKARQEQRVQSAETQQQQSNVESQALPPQPPSNPLQQLSDRAAKSLMQTAKSVLPTPVISTAKQAMRVINSSNRPRQQLVPSMSLNGGGVGSSRSVGDKRTMGSRRETNRLSSDFVDWYPDETMEMYLKDK